MKRLLCAATALGAVVLVSPAHAGLLLDESVNGGLFAPICGPSVNVCSPGLVFTDGAGITFLILGASSNAPGTPTGADVTQAAVRVTNGSGLTEHIVLRAGDTGFTAPTGAVTLSNNISGTVVTGSAVNLFSSTACADPGNGQNNCAGGAFVTAALNADITVSNSSGASSNSLGIASLGAPFSLTQVSDFTLGAGSVITYSNSADVAPAPEPGTLGLLGIGLLGIGYVSARRRST